MTSNLYIRVHPFLPPSQLFAHTVPRVSHAKSVLVLKAAFTLIRVQTSNKISIILPWPDRKTKMRNINRTLDQEIDGTGVEMCLLRLCVAYVTGLHVNLLLQM